MANPNKTFAKAAKNIQRAPLAPRTPDEFTAWLIKQAQAGKSFKTLEEAREAFDTEADAV